MKSIALIARTIFPSQSPRSSRATNLAIALSENGFQVNIYCLKGTYDYSKFENKYNIKVHNLGNSWMGNGNSDTGIKSKTLLFRVFNKLFGQTLLFPEIELLFMIFKKRNQILKNDYFISIAAPFSIHFGMNLIHQKEKIWISDCGDPFMGNPHKKYPFYLKYLENSWAKNTHYITIPTQKAIPAYPAKYKEKLIVIPQGFPITENLDKNYHKNKIPTFCYSGTIYTDHRNPSDFLNFLTTLAIDYKFIVYTKNTDFFHAFKEKLGDKLVILNYIRREDLLVELSKMDFLVNFKNESSIQMPSKLIDYYMSNRPILEVSNTMSAAEKTATIEYLDYKFPDFNYDLSPFDIRNIANKFINLLNQKNG